MDLRDVEVRLRKVLRDKVYGLGPVYGQTLAWIIILRSLLASHLAMHATFPSGLMPHSLLR